MTPRPRNLCSLLMIPSESETSYLNNTFLFHMRGCYFKSAMLVHGTNTPDVSAVIPKTSTLELNVNKPFPASVTRSQFD